jgi:Flp pilus assembly protein TadG
MMIKRPRQGSRHGTAAVEVAVLLPLFLVPLLIGVWEVGRLVEVQ